MRGALCTCLVACETLVALLSPALGQDAGPVLIKEMTTREFSIHVGGVQTPDIKEVVSREQVFFIDNGPANPYAQVVSRQVSLVDPMKSDLLRRFLSPPLRPQSGP